MNNDNSSRHIVDILFVLGLFLLFSISALFLVLFGASIYKNTTKRMNQGYEDRTSFAYVTEKIRQADSSGAVSVADFDGINSLIITKCYDGVEYYNYIYMKDGYLKELITCETSMKGIDGEDILPVKDFSIESCEGGLYRISLTGLDDNSMSFYVSTRSD